MYPTLYMPVPATIERIEDETPDIKTFTIRPVEPIPFAAGQFVELAVPGIGEDNLSRSVCADFWTLSHSDFEGPSASSRHSTETAAVSSPIARSLVLADTDEYAPG